jgi:DNA-binding MarR family transcriptional regulator
LDSSQNPNEEIPRKEWNPFLGEEEEELVAGLLLLSGKLVQRLDEVCRNWGITDDQYNVLRILRSSPPSGLTRSQIAELLFNRSPDVTRLLDRLEGKGLASRARSGPDRRMSISTITPKGLALLSKMTGDVRDAYMEVLEMLSTEERRTLKALVHRMI